MGSRVSTRPGTQQVLVTCSQGLAHSRNLQSPLDTSLAIVPSPFWGLKTIRHQEPEVLGSRGQSLMMKAEPGTAEPTAGNVRPEKELGVP